MKFEKGDKLLYYVYKTPSGRKLKKPIISKCTVVQDCERHVTLDFGNYKGSVLKSLLLTGEEKLERVS